MAPPNLKSENPNDRAPAADTHADRSPATLQERLAELLGQRRRPEELLRMNASLLQENHTLHEALDGIRAQHEQIRHEVDTLCQPEHYPAVITGVECNG